MDDVAVDAKRILLRYGAPINVLDDVAEVERIELARLIARTNLPERERHLRQVLADRGYMEPPPVKTRKSRAKAAQAPPPTSAAPSATPAPAAKPAAKAPQTAVRKSDPKVRAGAKGPSRPRAAAKAAAGTRSKAKTPAKTPAKTRPKAASRSKARGKSK